MKLLALVLLAAGCGEQVHVNIDCQTTMERTVECSVKQTEGKGEVEACWDFKVTCANKAEVTAPRTCQKVKDGGTEKVTITTAQLVGIDKCGGTGKPTGALTNLTLNGKKL